jgi:hypothetical protein
LNCGNNDLIGESTPNYEICIRGIITPEILPGEVKPQLKTSFERYFQSKYIHSRESVNEAAYLWWVNNEKACYYH